jgi:hypothetical protein
MAAKYRIKDDTGSDQHKQWLISHGWKYDRDTDKYRDPWYLLSTYYHASAVSTQSVRCAEGERCAE